MSRWARVLLGGRPSIGVHVYIDGVSLVEHLIQDNLTGTLDMGTMTMTAT